MVVLDTGHMSLLEWGGAGSAELRERLAELDEDEVATTIISYEEQMRGWMAYVAKARSVAQQIEAYRRLLRHLDNYRRIPVLEFTEHAAIEYQQLRRSRVRIGTMDLEIAAIVLSLDATLCRATWQTLARYQDCVWRIGHRNPTRQRVWSNNAKAT